VRRGGNARARGVTERALQPRDDPWRGLGVIPGGALGLKPEFADADAEKVLGLPAMKDIEPPGCLCSQVVAGMVTPPACALFAERCTPEDPVGPCMVSSEGTCAAWFRYGGAR
jgi:hydrogenase expression/formation protein HypD